MSSTTPDPGLPAASLHASPSAPAVRLTQVRYSAVAKLLHWAIALLILGQIAGGLYMHNLPNSADMKFELYQLHKSFGLTILALSLFRLFWRLTHKGPPLPRALPDWERILARVTHVGFYVLMIGVPLVGWAMVSASPLRIPTKLFFVIPVPDLPLPRSRDLAEILAETHEYAAFTILGLLALHVAGGLKHHFVDRNGILARMVPGLNPPAPKAR
jgi:cytochrome b561